MWFKQVQILQLSDFKRFSEEELSQQIEPFAFTPCLPSFPSSMGWVSPIEEEGAPLVHHLNGYLMLCLQIEEKILPATVIRQKLLEKIKHIETTQERRVRSKEKLTLKDEVTMTLLPRAFSKLSRLYAYIDTKNHWVILATTSPNRTEQFVSLFKKSIHDGLTALSIKKIAPYMTQWLKSKDYPDKFSIEKSCVLQDANQQNRVIRCQQQNLFADSIQAFVKEGCEVKQLAMCWLDRINFILADDFSVRSIQYNEEILAEAKDSESETKAQQFAADFFIMTETLSALIKDLLHIFGDAKETLKSTRLPLPEIA